MSKQSVSKVLAAAVVLALTGAAVHADTVGKKPTKEQKIGMASGTAIGALVGGPFGAGVGFIVGAITGGQAGETRSAKQTTQSLEKQLADAKKEFAEMSAKQQAEQNGVIEQLAQRLRADVLFRTANAELDPISTQKLNDLGTVLSAFPDLIIEIDGYADPRGKSDVNDELSQQRASAVRAALIVGGASPDKIKVSAHGEKLSTANKDDLEAYAWERRVSLSVIAAQGTSQVAQVK